MLTVYGKKFDSRLLIGTASYPSCEIMTHAIQAAQSQIVTVALKRQITREKKPNYFWEAIQKLGLTVLPNTAGCHHAKDAIMVAHMAREIFNTTWIKLEVIGDDYTLQPHSTELIVAAKQLVRDGFDVFPYCTDDLMICQHLLDCGCDVLMPWASPIGSGLGLLNPYALTTLRHRFPQTTLIVDAGLGSPRDAVAAMELGLDAVLVNSAIALAIYPVLMAGAFCHGVQAGRMGWQAGRMPKRDNAKASTPLMDTPFWKQEES